MEKRNMKIWRAVLVLSLNENDEYVTKFKFEQTDKEYEENKENWSWYEGWVGDIIPKKMTIGYFQSYYKVEQGFNKKLTKEELDKLQKDMKTLMIKQIEYDKEKYLNNIEKKLAVLKK